jgi:chitinase
MSKITHLNIAFGLIYHNEALNEQSIPNWPADKNSIDKLYLTPEVQTALEKVRSLKKQYPQLNVLLSVGGWGARGFSHVASTELTRKAFAKSVKQVVNMYGLDGIDIDWEYPVNGGWGAIAAAPEDKANYTLLLKELRQSIEKDKLLTVAGGGWSYLNEWTNPADYVKLLDYINIMTYDFGFGGPMHNSNLFNSKEFPDYGLSIDSYVNMYLGAGIPKEKINIGTPFYGRVPTTMIDTYKSIIKDESLWNGEMAFTYEDIITKLLPSGLFTRHWDNDAKAAYLTAKDPATGMDVFLLSYDDPQTIEYKTNYIKEKGLGGAMFWQFAGDYKNELAGAIANGLGIESSELKK